MRGSVLTLVMLVIGFTTVVSGSSSLDRSRRRNRLRDSRYLTATPVPEVKPGFKGRITQKGFDYAADIAIDMLMGELDNLRIPDQVSDVSFMRASLRNIRVTEFPRPSSRLDPIDNYGMRWIGYEMNPIINADYEAKFDWGLWTTTKRGTVAIRGRRIHFTLVFLIGRDANGRPTTRVHTCRCVGDISLSFTGGWSDALNLGSSVFSSSIESFVTGQICAKAKAEINEKLEQQFAALPIRVGVEHFYELDFGMIKFPVFSSEAVETFHKGSVHFMDNDDSIPLTPVDIPAFPEHTERMIYVYVTDYIINSGLYASFVNRQLTYNLTQHVIPADMADYLSTTCPLDICIGTVFPQLEVLYPNTHAAVNVFAVRPPRVRIQGNKLHLTASGEADVFADLPDRKQFLFSINMTVSGSVGLAMTDNKLLFNVTSLQPEADIQITNIGDIGTGFFFESLLRLAVQKVVLPKLQELGWQGLPMPEVQAVKLHQPTILDHDTENILIFATDIGNLTIPV